MKKQDINFNRNPISSEKIKSYQDFDAILNKVENSNSDKKTKTVFMSFSYSLSNPYFSIAASICLLCVIGMGLFLAQNNTNSNLELAETKNKTDLAYSITNKDLETAERLTASISQKVDLPAPKNGTAITTTILEENASPENASLEQVAQVLRTEMNKENLCKLTTSSLSSSPKYIAFVVSSEGQITDIEAQGCEQEARRVLNSFPKWKSGTLQGQHLSQRVVVAI
jgi:hypothetical protein